jgi:hypothetical protein
LAGLREQRYQATTARPSRCSPRGAGEICVTNAFWVKDFAWRRASSAATGDNA